MASNRPRIQAYVDQTTYDSLRSQAQSRGISISELASEVLSTVSADVTQGDSMTHINSKSDFVTVTQLRDLLQSFRQELMLHVTREITRAETQFEGMAEMAQAGTQVLLQKILEGVVVPDDVVEQVRESVTLDESPQSVSPKPRSSRSKTSVKPTT